MYGSRGILAFCQVLHMKAVNLSTRLLTANERLSTEGKCGPIRNGLQFRLIRFDVPLLQGH